MRDVQREHLNPYAFSACNPYAFSAAHSSRVCSQRPPLPPPSNGIHFPASTAWNVFFPAGICSRTSRYRALPTWCTRPRR